MKLSIVGEGCVGAAAPLDISEVSSAKRWSTATYSSRYRTLRARHGCPWRRPSCQLRRHGTPNSTCSWVPSRCSTRSAQDTTDLAPQSAKPTVSANPDSACTTARVSFACQLCLGRPKRGAWGTQSLVLSTGIGSRASFPGSSAATSRHFSPEYALSFNEQEPLVRVTSMALATLRRTPSRAHPPRSRAAPR